MLDEADLVKNLAPPDGPSSCGSICIGMMLAGSLKAFQDFSLIGGAKGQRLRCHES
jgi:hypothetical protein